MNHTTIRLLALCSVAAAGCGSQNEFMHHPPEEHSAATALVVQTCTALNARGGPVAGNLCGGSDHAFNCSPGLVYKCADNVATNNCVLDKICQSGCITDPQLNDFCFAGIAPLSLAVSSVPGGADVSATATLFDPHPGGAIVNMRVDRGDLVAARASCNVPDLPAGVTSATFAMPTAVVSAPIAVSLYDDIAYTDTSSISRQLVSLSSTLTLQPGGSAQPTPLLASFTLSPSTIAAGGLSTMDVVLQRMAPIPGVQVTATSSNPSVASIIAGGQPFVQPGCTGGGGAQTVQAANVVSANTTVTISASSGAAGQAPLTNPLTVTTGCAPKTCLDLAMPACTGPDGCGGTLQCGCNFGQTCGGGGTPGVCGGPTAAPAPASVSALAITPTTVQGGSSATGAVTLSAAAPQGGAVVSLSSSSASASVPASVTVAAGQTSASFSIATAAVGAATSATISATLGGTQSATLSITAAPATTGSVLTLTATGRSGVSVFSSPTGLNVLVGTTGSATFATGTSITLTPTNGRTAFWSGACTMPRDTSSCTFTLTGNASVTANVQ